MAENKLALVTQDLKTLLETRAKALPSGFNQVRFMQNCLAVLRNTKDLEKMDYKSIASTMLKGAFLGLDFYMKECYAIPYNKNIGTKDKPKYVKELNFQTDYKGEIKLIKKYSVGKPIKDVYAKVVRQGDEFKAFVAQGMQMVSFNPKPFNNAEIVGAFGVCLYADGTLVYEAMSIEEIFEVRDAYAKKDSNGQYSKAWRESVGEMCKKTVLRRLCKLFSLEFESVEQAKEFDGSSDFGFNDELEVQEPPVEMPTLKTEEAVEAEPDLLPTADDVPEAEPEPDSPEDKNRSQHVAFAIAELNKQKSTHGIQSIVTKYPQFIEDQRFQKALGQVEANIRAAAQTAQEQL